MDIPKKSLQDYQKGLTQDQSAKLIKKMAWCNSKEMIENIPEI